MDSSKLDSLTKAEFERLYTEENLTESEIAALFGTYQVKINRLRKKYGIPTISKSDRYDLPAELSREQKMLLAGSMLGDGRLFPTGSETAGYSEFHSNAQLPYLQWKAEKWGPFVQSLRPGSYTRKDGKTFEGHTLRLKGCRHFRHVWETLYPSGAGFKTFIDFPISQLTGFAIAVWYMDDGSRTHGGHVRFSVSPKEEDQAVLLKLLGRFQIEAEAYTSNGDHEIIVGDRSNLTRFLDLVSPYVPACMAHKLQLFPRSLGSAPREKLTPDVVRTLVDKGMGIKEMAATFNVSINSVRRGFDKAGILRGKTGRPRKSSVSSRFSVLEAEHLIKEMADQDLNEESIASILERTVFPERQLGPKELARDWELLCSSTTHVKGHEIIGTPRAGIWLCDQFFRHRFDAQYGQMPSVRVAWHDSTWLRRAIHFQHSVGDPFLPWNVYRALRGVVRTPSNFRPGVAKAIVESFCPEGGLVLDPCGGYGGRAAGTLAAGRKYIGVDPHPKAKEAFEGLFAFTGSKDAKFYNVPFEDVSLGTVKADLVFTSPPYFSAERYADDPSQSWVRYKTWNVWREGFLVPLLTKAFSHLRPGGAFCLNIADVNGPDHKRVPLTGESVRIAKEIGYSHEATLLMPLGRFGKVTKAEPIFVLRKPEK